MDTSTALEASSSSPPSSSSSSTTSSSSPYDVFLSFGEDARKTFTDHLYWTMKDAGIDFFMEENESIRRGESISDKVKQIIEGSKVSVIVFSSRYADSIWCLEELVQIMECRRTLKQMVLPIFYDLSPSDVIGTFVLAFQKHRERFHEDTDIQEKLRRWTDALTAAAFMAVWTDTLTAAAGFTVRVFRTTNGYEGRFIRAIIDEITSLLQSPTPIEIAFTDLQGIDSPELALYLLSSALSPLSTPPGKLDSLELALSPPGNLDSPELALSLMSGAKSPLSTPPGKLPRSRSSRYRGVTFYRRTGRWESHIWDCGKQVYLGGFDTAHAAARAYDRAAIKFRGIEADINFSVSDYEDDIKQMSNFTKEEFVHILRRQSTGFSRGSSKFRGVTLHKCGRWEARMGQFLGKKAYDKAAIKCNGREAVTNFDRSSYDGEIMSEANNEGSHQSLDLNLGIAPPLVSEIQKENMNLRSFPFQLGCNDIPVHLRARNEISVPAPMRSHLSHGSIVASEEPPIMSNMNSSFFPIHMERATEKSKDVNSFPNWAWQLQGLNGGATSMPLFSAAASSGFPSSTATSSSSAVTQLHFPNTAILHHHFSPSFTNNIPHFYCRS